MKRIFLGATASLTMLLSACGGGTAADTGGTASGLLSNAVSVASPVLKAGQSTTLTARAVMRGAVPNSMSWSLSPLFTPNPNDPVLAVSDLNCAAASYAVPAVPGASGEGSCEVILSAPFGAKAGVWRIKNTASSASAGMVSNSVDVTVEALPASGFHLVGSSTPIIGYANTPLSLTIPFTSSTDTAVTDVQYQWTAAAQNPSTNPIAGSRSSTASVVPTVPGQYRFDLLVNVSVNVHTETAFGSVVAVVYPATVTDVVGAGSVQVVTPGDVVTLTGSILNRDATMVYVTSWRQLDGAAGGPFPVMLLSANALASSFTAPNATGKYGFEFKVVKSLADGTQAITTAQTTVVVQSAPSGIFSVVTSDVQSLTAGSVAILSGSVGVQGGSSTGVVYTYAWTQVGTSPEVVTLSNSTTQKASFIPKATGTYTFNLTVTATTKSGVTTVSGSTQVNVTPVTTTNFNLSASAGNAQAVVPNALVTLTGATTVQGALGGVVYDYTWTQIGTSPATVTLSNVKSTTASFMPTVIGTYGFRFTVVATLPDGTVRTATAETQVIVSKATPPVSTFSLSASAGNAQEVVPNAVVTLTGATTVQGALVGVVYDDTWTQIGTSPATVTLSNVKSTTASFMTTVIGTYGFRFTVVATLPDGTVRTATADTQVIVSNASSPPAATFALSASAGPAQSVALNVVTTLTGSQTSQGSTSGVTYMYSWVQIDSSPATTVPVTLSNASTPSATFLPTVSGIYWFRLLVNATLADGTIRSASADTQVLVGGVGNTFTVSAGDAKVVAISTATTMVGTVATQGAYTGTTFSYLWTQVGFLPAAVTVANSTALTSSFIPTVAGTYSFDLTVIAVQSGVSTSRSSRTQVLVTP